MKIIKTQNQLITLPIARIIRTTVEKKSETCWVVTATVEHDRPVVLGRYPSEKEALKADIDMWMAPNPCYEFPISSVVAPEERIDDRQSKRHGGS